MEPYVALVRIKSCTESLTCGKASYKNAWKAASPGLKGEYMDEGTCLACG